MCPLIVFTTSAISEQILFIFQVMTKKKVMLYCYMWLKEALSKNEILNP